jgi:hypothetical protein
MIPKRTREQDEFEERAAILEFDANLPREQAEKLAHDFISREAMLDLVIVDDSDFA